MGMIREYSLLPRMIPVAELEGYSAQDIDDAAQAIEQWGDDELERYAAEYEAEQHWRTDIETCRRLANAQRATTSR